MRSLVWVVDDSPLDAERARRAVEGDCETRLFADGSSVLEELAAHVTPDLIVLDWVMPGISGIEVLQFMRAQPGRLEQVPVLLLTARGRPDQIVEGLSSGANDYVVKPYHPEELRARVAALLRMTELLDRARRAEESVRVLLANAPDALLVVDAQRRITYANEEAARVIGRGAGTLVGTDLEALVPDLALRNISIAPGTGLLPLPDVTVHGRILSPSIRVLPTDTAANTTISLRDVTERRRTEARRLDFYSIMAHDLRSPLSAMLMRAELLLKGRRGPLPAEALSDLRKFQASIRSMVKMIKDFLDLARMEGVGYKIDRERLDLVGLVAGIVDDLQPLAEASRIALAASAELDTATVAGDRQRLAQVVSNLVGNAIKFTPAGGHVEIRVRPLSGAYEVVVADDGPGIPPELLPTIFNRFTRGNPDQRSSGWGLGLMIVREIVEAHGGHVGVHSQPGAGSTFWFRLPRAPGLELPAAPAAPT